MTFKGKTIFLESTREALLRKVNEDGGTVVHTRATASIIVKDNLLAQQGLRNSLSMMLVGGALVDSSYVLKGHGPVFAYKRLLRTPKHVFLSIGFNKEFPGAVQVIQQAVASQGNPKQWHILSLTQLWDPNLVAFNFASLKVIIEKLLYQLVGS